MKHKLTRLTSLLLAFIMTFSMLLVPVEAAEFSDVPEGCWYAGAVDYVYEKGWMVGVGDSTFAPNLEVTRGMFVTVLAKYAQADLSAVEPAFTDTPAGAWYTDPCAWAAEKGIVAGAGDGLFLPNRSITRQDLVAILYRFIEKMGYSIPTGAAVSFHDMDQASAYAVDAVNFCASAGLVAGVGDGGFHPLDTATRSQLAVILMKLDSLVTGTQLPTDPRPAQDFGGEAGNDLTVTVNAPEGALPEDSSMNVTRVTDEADLEQIRYKYIAKLVAAVDISFNDAEGEEIEPEGLVEVQLQMEGLDQLRNPSVLHIKDDGSVELVGSQVVSVNRSGSEKALRFYADSFSVYAVFEDLVDTSKTITVYFHAKDPSVQGSDFEVINVQKLRIQDIQNRESPFYDPGVPGIKQTQSFEGWTTEPDYLNEQQAGIAGYDVDGMNRFAKQIAQNPSSLSANTDLHFYAKVYNVVYVIYHDQAGAVQDTVMHRLLSGNSVNAEIEFDYVPFKDNQKMQGWVTKEYVDLEQLGDYPVYKPGAAAHVIKDGETRNVSATLELYPYLENGYWMSFNNNIEKNNEINDFDDDTRAAYVAPHFYGNSETPEFPEIPDHTRENARPGYYLEGWYTDPYMQNKYDFDHAQPLTEDITLYAKWEKRTARYRVIIWQQRSTDPIDAVDSVPAGNPENKTLKTWDYYSPNNSVDAIVIEKTVTTGTEVGLENAHKRMGNRNNSHTNFGEMGFFFDFNENLSTSGTVKVKGDGSTVIEAYYDRKVITVNFRTNWTASTYDYITPTADAEYSNGYYYRERWFNVNETHYGSDDGYAIKLNLTSSDNNYPDENGWVFAGYVRSSSRNGTYYEYNGSGNTCVWKVESSGATYTGTVYGADTSTNASESSPIWNTAKGLYKAPLDWPGKDYLDIMWGINFAEDNSTSFLTPRDNFDIMDAKYTTVYDLWLTLDTGNNPKIIHWMTENVNDTNYTEFIKTQITDDYANQIATRGKFMGFTGLGYHLRSHNPAQMTIPPGDNDIVIRYENMGSNVYIYYSRNKYRLDFVSNNQTLSALPSNYSDPTQIKYQKSVAEYNDFKPTNGPEGMYFAGWYADPAFTTPFDFTQKMPDHNLTAYAKWETKFYRIVIHMVPPVKPGEPEPKITIPGTTQDTTFCIAYGTKIQTSALMGAQWKDHMILGLYYEQSFKNHFNPDTEAPFGVTDESYATAPNEERQGYDEFGDKEWSDVGWDNVRGRIDLYARWRKDPQGAVGINVEYLADNDPDTGHFSNDTNTWPDPKIYADLANAYGQAASTPDTDGEQFMYWEILDADDVPTGDKVYPGQTFVVHLEDAKVEREQIDPPQQNSVASPDGLRGNTNPVTYTPEQWVPYNESTIDTSKEYLIGFVYNNNTYLALNYNPSATNHYYYSHTFRYGNNITSDANSYVGYTGTPVFSGSNVTGVSGNATDLTYATWKFASVSNGYQIVSGYQNNRYLYAKRNHTTSSGWFSTTYNYYDHQYPYTTATVWSWDAANHALQEVGASETTFAGVYPIGSTVYMTPDSASNDYTYVQLYVKQPATYTLTVRYKYEDGRTAGNDSVQNLQVGAAYRVDSPGKDGFWADPATVSGTMPAQDTTVTVTYHPIVVSEEEWEPMTTIEPGKNYLIAYIINGTPYLLVNKNVNNSDAPYYYSYESSNSTYTMGYLAKASVKTKNGVEYVTGASGAATELRYCHWNFSEVSNVTNGYKIYSGLESDRGLYWDHSGVYPFTSPDTWVWTITNQNSKLGTFHNTYTNPNTGRTNDYYLMARSATGSTTLSSEPYYAGIYSSGNTSIRLYKKHVTDQSTWTVEFLDDDLTEIVSVPVYHNQTVTKPSDPTKSDYYFLGWYEPNADKPFDFNTRIIKDVTLIARYMYMYDVTYTVRLRAVYGREHTTPNTHIYWYANDGTDADHGEGAGDRYEDTDVEMYTTANIPYPTAGLTPQGENTWIGSNASVAGLEREGYEFLGWARKETLTESGELGQGYPDLSITDLYFIWDAEHKQYLYNRPVEPIEDDPSADYNNAAAKGVIATEDQPYHDFYAVWRKLPFYVFHSATGKLEAIDSNMIGPEGYDLTATVTPGYLYGGYYVDSNKNGTYGYLPKAAMDNIVASYKNGTLSWSPDLDEETPLLASYVITNDKVSAYQTNNRIIYQTYNGAMYTNGQGTPYMVLEYDENGKPIKFERSNGETGDLVLYPLAWDKNDAATLVRGDQLQPQPGMVYYLKEVPTGYLSSKVLFTYDQRDLPVPGATDGSTRKNQIVDLWALTLTDDPNYREVGFQYARGKSASDVNAADLDSEYNAYTRTFTLIQRPASDGSSDMVTVNVEAKDFGMRKGCGYVAVKHLTDYVDKDNPAFTMLPYWITKDGITVHNNGLYWSKVDQGAYDPENPAIPQMSWERVFDGTEKLYVNTNTENIAAEGDGRFNWREDNAVIEIMFAKDEDVAGPGASAVLVLPETEIQDLSAITVPAGEWTKVLICRMSPSFYENWMNNNPAETTAHYFPNAGEGRWDKTEAIQLNALTGSHDNYLKLYYDGSDFSKWGNYPELPSTTNNN